MAVDEAGRGRRERSRKLATLGSDHAAQLAQAEQEKKLAAAGAAAEAVGGPQHAGEGAATPASPAPAAPAAAALALGGGMGEGALSPSGALSAFAAMLEDLSKKKFKGKPKVGVACDKCGHVHNLVAPPGMLDEVIRPSW